MSSHSHKWEIGWDDASDSCIDVCKNCRTKRRNKVLYFKGTMRKSGTITEYFVNGVWNPDVHPPCLPNKPKK